MKWGHNHLSVSDSAVSPRVCREAGGADTSWEPQPHIYIFSIFNYISILNISLNFINYLKIGPVEAFSRVKYSKFRAKYTIFKAFHTVFIVKTTFSYFIKIHKIFIFINNIFYHTLKLYLNYNIFIFCIYYFLTFFFFIFLSSQPHRSKSKISWPPLYVMCSSSEPFPPPRNLQQQPQTNEEKKKTQTPPLPPFPLKSVSLPYVFIEWNITWNLKNVFYSLYNSFFIDFLKNTKNRQKSSKIDVFHGSIQNPPSPPPKTALYYINP